MLKVVLVGVNSRFSHMNPALYSIYDYVDGHLAPELRKDFDIVIREFNINQDRHDVRAALLHERADLYLFSCYIWNISYIDHLLSYLGQSLPDASLIGGGPEVQHDIKEEYLRQKYWDFLMPGDGEVEVLDILNSLTGETTQADLKAFWEKLRQDKSYLDVLDLKEDRKTVDMDKLPFYYPHYRDKLSHKIVTYESSRACPFRCSYCVSSLEGRPRFKSLDRVYKELDYFFEEAIPLVKFLDRSSNFPADRSFKIFSYLIDKAKTRQTYPCFHFELEASLLDEATVELLEKAPQDLFQFEIGVQSIHEETLKRVNRHPMREQDYVYLDRLIKAKRQHIHLDLIAGLPGETLDQLESSFNKLWQLQPDMLQLGHLKLLRGTGVREDAIRLGYGFNLQPPYEVYRSDAMCAEEIILTEQVAHMTDAYPNKGLLVDSMDFLLKHTDLSPFRMLAELFTYYRAWQGEAFRSLSLDETLFVYLDYLFSEWPELFEEGLEIFKKDFENDRKSGSLAWSKVVQKLGQSGKINTKLYTFCKEAESHD